MASFLIAAGLAAVVSAQVPVWGQCGGTGYSGSTACASGSYCSVQNSYYSQCLPGTGPIASSAAATTLTTAKASSTAAAPSAPTGTKYLISFGDSYSQTGFDINGNKPSAANPLGNPALPGWTASGGLDWVGYMVTQYNNSLLLSYNLAYGGATTDANLVKPYASTVLSFIDQVSIFSKNLASKPSYAPWTAQNTLIGVWMGVNDVGNSFWLSNRTEVNTAVVSRYFEQLQIIYNAGARNFALLTVPPTQKTPAMLANGADSNAQLAAAIQQYNDLIASNLQAFKSKNSGVNAWTVDTTAPFNEAINNPTKYGAPNATCYNSDGVSCLWFNDYHPGVKIQGLVAQAVAKTVGSAFFKA